ncbi:hypothetical protein EJB05_36422, partial [Eragrostis curvula]
MPTCRCRPATALASADRRRDTAMRTFFLLCGGGCCAGGGAAAAFSGGDTKSSEWKDGQAEENAMAASSSSSASEFMNSASPIVAPWLLLLPRTGHLKCLREKERESWGFLALSSAVFSYLEKWLAQLLEASRAKRCNGPVLFTRLESCACVGLCEIIFRKRGVVWCARFQRPLSLEHRGFCTGDERLVSRTHQN